MIEISIISSRERRLGFFLSLALGLTLATTLLPGIHSLYLNLLRFLPLTRGIKATRDESFRICCRSVFSIYSQKS